MSTRPPEPPGNPADPPGPGDLADLAGLAGLLELTGDEAVLPAGSRLADEQRAGHQCFVILDGAATVERDGRTVRNLGRGAFVGEVDAGGRPLAPSGVTVRLATRSRVYVLDAARLAAAFDADPGLAAAWRSLISRT
jgi:CRP-like cAMP-binding protein